MTNRKDSQEVGNWTSETIQKFVDSASMEEIEALQVTFERQAELMRRHGKEESVAFWDALAKGIADAVADRVRQISELRRIGMLRETAPRICRT